ncbi:MAG TPA: hypothetical protein VJL32_03955 [Candidatus Paceibacterota bacterium]
MTEECREDAREATRIVWHACLWAFIASGLALSASVPPGNLIPVLGGKFGGVDQALGSVFTAAGIVLVILMPFVLTDGARRIKKREARRRTEHG